MLFQKDSERDCWAPPLCRCLARVPSSAWRSRQKTDCFRTLIRQGDIQISLCYNYLCSLDWWHGDCFLKGPSIRLLGCVGQPMSGHPFFNNCRSWVLDPKIKNCAAAKDVFWIPFFLYRHHFIECFLIMLNRKQVLVKLSYAVLAGDASSQRHRLPAT